MKIQPVIAFLVLLLIFVVASISNLVISEENKYKDFEKDTWLNIDQLTEKYNVSRNQILEKYNSIKFNEQTLINEMSNALNKTK